MRRGSGVSSDLAGVFNANKLISNPLIMIHAFNITMNEKERRYNVSMHFMNILKELGLFRT
jgi:hypothetical protein